MTKKSKDKDKDKEEEAPRELKSVVALLTEKAGSLEDGQAPPPLARKKMAFLMDGKLCSPGMFPGDFRITLQSLTVGQERKVYDARQDSHVALAYEFAKQGMWKVGDDFLNEGTRDLMWEALGAQGRVVVVAMYSRIGAKEDAALGKAEKSLEFF